MRSRLALVLVLAVLAGAPAVAVLLQGPPRDVEDQQLHASGIRLEGDPISSEGFQARAEVADRAAAVELKQTPAAFIQQTPRGKGTQNASPLSPVDARLSLEAGPVVLEGPGEVSPRYPLHARASAAADDEVDRAWLRLDGDRWALLEPAGVAGDRHVFLGRLAAGVLPAHRTTYVDVVFERRPAPGVEHWTQGPGWDVYADDRGPAAPEVLVEGDLVRLEGPGERFQARARPANGSWRPVPVADDTVEELPAATDQVRARGVDAVGNAGPWSSPVAIPEGGESSPAHVDWRLLAPEDGARVEGTVDIDWRPRDASIPVEVRARSDPRTPWQEVGQAHGPPIAWHTAFVPDGDWRLHVRAHTDEGWSSRLLTVTVDNLEETVAGSTSEHASVGTPETVDPRTRAPVSAALASGAGLLVAMGLVGRAWIRRAK